MESLKKILLFFIAGLYLFLSTGVILLQTHCLCSDSTRISLYADSESCEEMVSDHGCCECENSCNDPNTSPKHDSCGCDKPIVTYLKLTNHLADGSNLEYSINKPLFLVHYKEASSLKPVVFSLGSTGYPDYSPPENTHYGRYLITLLHQRKIALAA